MGVARAITYPQSSLGLRKPLAWLTPPPLGRVLVLAAYWITIVVLLTCQSIVDDAYYYERIAYRAAWMSATQLPFTVVLAGKANIIGYLIGSSHERLSWLHRWVSRTLLITITIHGGFFLTEWWRADFVQDELAMMPMVKYGIGAWSVLLWMSISGLAPFRNSAWELFHYQHLTSIAVFLWLLYKHIPAVAIQFLWISISFVVFDRIVRMVLFIWQNLNFLDWGTAATVSQRTGYKAELLVVSKDVTLVTIRNVRFTWSAGQYFFLWIPRVGLLESHPFTALNIPPSGAGRSETMTLAIRAHSHLGFARRLHAFASKASPATRTSVFLQGPFGSCPSWNAFESVLLIAASTGASFTLPVLEKIVRSPGCARQVAFLLLVQEQDDAQCYLPRLQVLARRALAIGLRVNVHIAVTRGRPPAAPRKTVGDGSCAPKAPQSSCCGDAPAAEPKSAPVRERQRDAKSSPGSHPTAVETEQPQNSGSCCGSSAPVSESEKGVERDGSVQFTSGRPCIRDAVGTAVGGTDGETCVAVCGGLSLSMAVRNEVAFRARTVGLSGSRDVFLHVESYGY